METAPHKFTPLLGVPVAPDLPQDQFMNVTPNPYDPPHSDSSFNAPSSTLFQSRTRVVVCALLVMMGIGMSAWAYQFNGPNGPILFWGILPGTPFVLLVALSLVARIPLRVLIGAYVGGLLAVAVPYCAIWYSSLNYNGGGANIGLGLLLIATLVLLPIPMLIGGFTGWWFGHTKSRS